MTKSKQYGVKLRRADALERLVEQLKLVEIALKGATEAESKKLTVIQKRMNKEIANIKKK